MSNTHSTISGPATESVRHVLSSSVTIHGSMSCATPRKVQRSALAQFPSASSSLSVSVTRLSQPRADWRTCKKQVQRHEAQTLGPLLRPISATVLQLTENLRCQDPATVHAWSQLVRGCGSLAQERPWFKASIVWQRNCISTVRRSFGKD